MADDMERLLEQRLRDLEARQRVLRDRLDEPARSDALTGRAADLAREEALRSRLERAEADRNQPASRGCTRSARARRSALDLPGLRPISPGRPTN